jgi:hypothetical protein
VVPSGLFIKLTKIGADDTAFAGDLDITAPVTIAGGGPLTTVVNGNATDRVFDIASGVEPVRISGLRIENGQVQDAGGGGIRNGGTLEVVNSLVTGNTINSFGLTVHGGGILNVGGVLTVSGSSVSGNSVSGSAAGGGIAQTNGRTVTVVNSTISGNRSGAVGGGLYDAEGAGVTVQGSTVTGNEADTQGGGFYLFGLSVTAYSLSNTTIADNKAAAGGGIWLNAKAATTLTRLNLLRNQATNGRGGGISLEQAGSGLVRVRESRISSNSASQGGGGMATQGSGAGDILVEKTTIDGNNAAEGDGISTAYTGAGNELRIRNTTISGNGLSSSSGNGGGLHAAGLTTTVLSNITLASNTAGAAVGDNIYNLGSLSAKNTIATDPGNGQNCGGTNATNVNNLEPPDVSTSCGWTPGSPILAGDLGNNGGPTPTHAIGATSKARNTGMGCEATDQRGVPRNLSGACDIGAYERVLCFGQPVNRVGTNGNDRMTGGAAAEVFLTLGGRDVVNPGGGNDRLCLGTGNDTARIRGNGIDRAHGQGGSRDRVIRDSRDIVRGFERFG